MAGKWGSALWFEVVCEAKMTFTAVVQQRMPAPILFPIPCSPFFPLSDRLLLDRPAAADRFSRIPGRATHGHCHP